MYIQINIRSPFEWYDKTVGQNSHIFGIWDSESTPTDTEIHPGINKVGKRKGHKNTNPKKVLCRPAGTKTNRGWAGGSWSCPVRKCLLMVASSDLFANETVKHSRHGTCISMPCRYVCVFFHVESFIPDPSRSCAVRRLGSPHSSKRHNSLWR